MTDTTASELCDCPRRDHVGSVTGRCVNPSIRSESADMGIDRSRYRECGCCMADCPDVHGPEGRLPAHYRYEAQWLDEGGEFVGLATEFPSLSFLAPTPYEALAGIKSLAAEVLRDMARTGESPPVPTREE